MKKVKCKQCDFEIFHELLERSLSPLKKNPYLYHKKRYNEKLILINNRPTK
jgi:hypothetical protein